MIIATVSLISCNSNKKSESWLHSDKPTIPKKEVVTVSPGEYAYVFHKDKLYEFTEDMAVFEYKPDEMAPTDSIPMEINKVAVGDPIQRFLAPFYGDSTELTVRDPKLTVVPQPGSQTYEVHLDWMTMQRR